MALHDAYARRTPYELAFPSEERASALLAEIDEEAAGRGADPDEPYAFVTMAAAAAYVRSLEGPDAEPRSMQPYGALVYHGVRFLRAGRPLYLLDARVARHLVDSAPDGEPEPPAAAGYMQLPQHLFWAETDETEGGGSEGQGQPGGAAPPQSADGVFWSVATSGTLHTLLVTGMRADRPGVGVVPLPEAPLADAAGWLDVDVRGDGRDFASALPGSELDRLYGFRAAGEILKLLARFFAYAHASPSALVPGRPAATTGDVSASALPYTRVVLDA